MCVRGCSLLCRLVVIDRMITDIIVYAFKLVISGAFNGDTADRIIDAGLDTFLLAYRTGIGFFGSHIQSADDRVVSAVSVRLR